MNSKLKLAYLLSMMLVASAQHYVMASAPERNLGDKWWKHSDKSKKKKNREDSDISVMSERTETVVSEPDTEDPTEVEVLSRATRQSEITRTRTGTTSKSSKSSKSSKGTKRSKGSKCGKGSKSGKGYSKGYSKGYYYHKGGKGSKGGKSAKGGYRYYRGRYDCYYDRFDRRSDDISVKSVSADADERRSRMVDSPRQRAASFTAATAGLIFVAVAVRKKLMNRDGGDKTHPLTGVAWT